MQTITLRVNDDSLRKLYKLLEQLPEVEVIEDKPNFQADKAYLHKALSGLQDGSNPIVSVKELENNMEKVISMHEN